MYFLCIFKVNIKCFTSKIYQKIYQNQQLQNKKKQKKKLTWGLPEIKFWHAQYGVDEFSNTFDNPLLSAMHCALWATVLMAFQKPQDL